MIQYVTGNLFTSPAQTLVNTVNTEGVMGKGVALAFKRLFPEMFEEYREVCQQGQLKIGRLHVFAAPPKLIVNFPTKTTWRQPSKPEYIEAGLRTFAESHERLGVMSAAFPPLGCGNGELDFATQVQPLMERFLQPLRIPIFIYPPLPRALHERLEHLDVDSTRRWLDRESRLAPFEALWTDLVEQLQRQSAYRALGTGAPVTATVVCEDAAQPLVRVAAPEGTFEFSRDDLADLWAELRQHLMLTTKSFPRHPDAAKYMLPVLASLPYLEQIELGDSYEALLHDAAYGVRFSPSSALSDQRDLALT